MSPVLAISGTGRPPTRYPRPSARSSLRTASSGRVSLLRIFDIRELITDSISSLVTRSSLLSPAPQPHSIVPRPSSDFLTCCVMIAKSARSLRLTRSHSPRRLWGASTIRGSSVDITPSPRILRMLGEIEFAEWQCIAELIDNAFDDFTEIQRSSTPWPGGFKVTVSLPSMRASLDDAEVVIQDTGRGMAASDLEKAVKAGWSSNDRFDKLGLFGMGFNVSTARLGRRTQVLTTRTGDPAWTGVDIDLEKIKEDFEATDLEEAKTDLSEHGTKIVIGNLKRPQAEWLQRNARQLRELLGNVYSWILSSSPVELWVDGVRVKPRMPCVWGADRYVNYGNGATAERIPAVINIDQKFAPADACSQCGNWQDPGYDNCRECGADQLIPRDRRIHGWVGIQRHLDKREFGIDFLRNGRKILTFDKRVFDWTNPNDPVAGTDTEYPVEIPNGYGRIVGEIHLDHVPVTYSKNAFEYSDRSWRAAMDFLRGEGPLLPRTADRLGYPKNISAIAKLIEGYRRNDAGRRHLVPGNGNGPIHDLTREWARKFWSGDPDYLTDQKWWDAIQSHEQRKNDAKVSAATGDSPKTADEAAVLAALGIPAVSEAETAVDKTIKPTEPTMEETLQERIDRISRNAIPLPELSVSFGLPELGVLELQTMVVADSPLHDEWGGKTPVWLKPGSGKLARVFIDAQHELFTRFGTTYEDAVLLELVPFLKIRVPGGSLSAAEVTSRLKSACLPHSAVDPTTVRNQAAELLLDVRTRMAACVEDDPQRAVQYLSPDERTAVENGVVNDGAHFTELVWEDGSFLLYAPALYLVKLVESWPEAFFDEKVFRGPYSTLTSPTAKRLSVAKVVGYVNDLATLVSAQTPPSAAQLQRTRWSCKLLSEEFSS